MISFTKLAFLVEGRLYRKTYLLLRGKGYVIILGKALDKCKIEIEESHVGMNGFPNLLNTYAVGTPI